MDFQSALETFAEAWVAANAQSALVPDKNHKQRPDRIQAMIGEAPDSSASTSKVQPSTTSPVGVKLLPIRCLIERTAVCGRKLDASTSVSTENYAIVPGTSLFRDVVHTALSKLGFSEYESATAKGSIHIKNWKALSVDAVTDNINATVEDVLGDLTSLATLKIVIASYGPSDDIKDKLLHFLVKHSRDLLQATGCPLAQELVDKVSTGSWDIPPEMRASFCKWYNENIFDETALCPLLPSSSPSVVQIVSRTPSKSRLRIYFDPELELPKLNMWFSINRHPSRQEMVEYLQELNSQPRRLNSKPLDLTNIMYWFKNARAAQRRLRRNAADACQDYDEEDSEEEDDQNHCDVPQPLINTSKNYQEGALPRTDEYPRSVPAPLQVMFTSSSGETEPTVPSCSTAPPAASTYYTSSDDDSDDEDDCDDISSAAHDENMQAEDLTMPKSACKSNATGENSVNDAPAPTDITGPQYVLDIKKESDSDVSKSSRSSSGASSPPSSMASAPTAHGVGANTPAECRFPYSGFAASYMSSSAASVLHPFFKTEQVQSYAKQRNGERQKRHRAFIDPVSEIPKLEQWFGTDTHPSHSVIEQICEDLNRGEFRSRYPKLTPKNIQLWFKNHRAKVKRLRMSQSHPDLCVLASSLTQPTY